MYQFIRIRGFRGVEDCTISDLGRVNLFTGYNGAGKTTILEAINVHAKPLDSGILLELDALRTGHRIRPSRSRSATPALPWGQLFSHGGKAAGEFTIDAMYGNETWGVSVRSSGLTSAVQHDVESVSDPLSSGFSAPIGELNVTCVYDNESFERDFVAFSNGVVDFIRPKKAITPLPDINVLRTSASNSNQQRLAEQYSSILGTDAEYAVLAAAKTVDRRISRLVVSASGTGSSLRADIGQGQLLELPLISDGLTRVVTAALGIAQCKDGAFLIDEFENGIFYGVLERTWRDLHDIATRLNVQLFATTHSMECIEAASRAIGDDLNLYRIDRSGGLLNVRRFDSRLTLAAIANAIDLR